MAITAGRTVSLAATLMPAFVTTLLLAGAARLPALAALSVRMLVAARISVRTRLLRTIAGRRASAGVT
jgi:hypothetical protein